MIEPIAKPGHCRIRAVIIASVLALFANTTVVSGAPRISEFMARNSSGLQDEDGDRSDWLEIHNPEAAPLNLDGWHLTDRANQKAKWRFPAVVIESGEYLVVFASSKDRRPVGGELHTNFSLSGSGEYLGLIEPDGLTVASEFFPEYPEQFSDVSYGEPSDLEYLTLVGPSDPASWVIPTSASDPASDWRDPGFDDGSWQDAAMGIGYENNAGGHYEPEIGAGGDTIAMRGVRENVCIRIPFLLPAGEPAVRLTLRLKYDDGFIGYLNGDPLMSGGTHLRRNSPDPLLWDSGASADHDDTLSLTYEDFDITESIGDLVAGDNVLAFQSLNHGLNSSDLLFRPELIVERPVSGGTLSPGHFAVPTPGAQNGGESSMIIPQTVVFSHPEGTFLTDFYLDITGDTGDQEIRYTTDGSSPGPSSTLFNNPVPMSASTWIRAAVFDSATGRSGLISGRHFEKLASSLTNYNGTGSVFKSSLPIMILNNLGAGEVPNDDQSHPARIHVIDRSSADGNYAPIDSAPALSSAVGVKIRGSSSAWFPKKSYGLELHDEYGSERAMEVLGMPAGSDWALISCYDYDRAFMRNAWIYDAARRNGQWAPRTRFVELFFNQDGDRLEYSPDYQGVYVLCEVIRAAPERLDITKIEPSNLTSPGLSGGYIFKVDRWDSDEYHWRTDRNLPPNDALVVFRPKLANLPSQQSSYLVDCFQDFEDALYTEAAGGFATRNYRDHINSVSWADHNLFNMVAKNVDALRLSAYFHKDRGRPIEGGVLWDFDRSADSTDGRDNDYDTWYGTGDGTQYFDYAWWLKLFDDIEFRQLYVDRWHHLRQGPLATSEVNAVFDAYLAEFRTGDSDHPARRDYAKWYGSPSANNLDFETNHLKTWVANRSAWVDSQFAAVPVLSPAAGPVPVGQPVSLTIPPGTTVYYTTDGSDPRAVGGGINPSAIQHSGALITVGSTTTITARAYRTGTYAKPATNWSAPETATYPVNEPYAAASSLRVTAVHYNPLSATPGETAAITDVATSDFEWIELANVSGGTINLEGVRMSDGDPVSLVVLPAHSLAAGEKILLVKKSAAFTERYGATAAARVLAEWPGDKSLNNGGETIWLQDRGGATIAYFSYNDSGDWPGRADGRGSSLEYLGTTQNTADYENPDLWRSSRKVHGEPGVVPSELATGIVINESLPSAVLPDLDFIELYNPGTSDIPIGGWFISNAISPSLEADYRKFRIPDGVVLGAGEFLVFTEADFNPNGSWNPGAGSPGPGEFSLDGYRGGDLWLVSADPADGALLNYQDKFEWTPMLPGTSIGSYPDATGDLTPLAGLTAGFPNAGPRIGEIQVSEIMYHPLGTDEYLELVNTSQGIASLDQWTLRGDVDFYFGPSHTLEPGEIALMVPFDPVLDPAAASAFRASLAVDPSIVLWGPWSPAAGLSDIAGTVRVRRMIPPPPEDPFWVGLMMEDEIEYLSTAPWPTGASGTGSSIHRLGVARWGSDPTAWVAADAGAGADAGGYVGWQRQTFAPGDPESAPEDDPDNDRIANSLEYLMGTDPHSFTTLASGTVAAHDSFPDRFYLDYDRRMDRGDYLLQAFEGNLIDPWLPAANDDLLESNGLLESRRAWIPTDAGPGFLRLGGAAAE